MRPTYLRSVWTHSPRLFLVVCIVLAGNLLTIALRRDVLAPIAQWNLYARPAPDTNTYAIYELRYNGGKVYNAPHTYLDFSRMMFNYTIPHYATALMGDTLFTNSTLGPALQRTFAANPYALPLRPTAAILTAYPAWLKRYMQHQIKEPLREIEVRCIWLRFEPDGTLTPVSQQTICRA